MKTAKFGGSSLADAAQFKKVKQIVSADAKRRVVVVSAPGRRFDGDSKVTDLLYLCHAHLVYGVNCDGVFAMIADRFKAIKDELGLATDIDAELNAIYASLNKSMRVDDLVSRGEYLCAKLMADYLGYAFIDAQDCIFFGFDGKVDYDKTNEALSRAYAINNCAVLPGFYGAMPDGSIKLMSRGGSDITGAIVAAALGAEVYENWTDVPGILMADPKIVENPKPIARATFMELRELSYMGANVLHEETVFPVRKANIPLNIRSTDSPDAPGTVIAEAFIDDGNERDRFITGISGKQHYSILSISKAHMSEDSRIIRKVLEILEGYRVNVEHIPTGIDSFSLVVPAASLQQCLYQLISDIEKSCEPDSVKVTEHVSLIAVVGRRMAYKPGISGRLFGTLGTNGINIRMIEQGADEINITVGVEDDSFEKAIKLLYNSFT